MSYSGSLLLYQDEPAYGLFLKLIIFFVPAGLLGGSVYLLSTGEVSGSLALLAEAVFIALIFWMVFPRKYQVYQDHLRIVLGGPIAIKIRFEKIKAVEVTGRTAFTVNFVTRIAWNYVIIVKKRGLSIAITPKSNELFADNANRALSEWNRTGPLESR
jgi:hypothetical protein